MQANSKLLNTAAAARYVQELTGEATPPAPTTLWRWATKGVSGVKVEHVRIGSKVYFTPEALQSFFEQVAAARLAALESTPTPAPAPRRGKRRTPEQREAAVSAALNALGA